MISVQCASLPLSSPGFVFNHSVMDLLSHPPFSKFTELLEHSGYEEEDDHKELPCKNSRLGRRGEKLSFTEHLLCAGDCSKHLTLSLQGQ